LAAAITSGTGHFSAGYPKRSTEPDISRQSFEYRPLLIGPWETGRTPTFKIRKPNLGDFAMPSRKDSSIARERLQLTAPISDDASLLKLEEYVAEYVREAKRRDVQQPDELISTVVDAVAHDYFRHVFRKQIRRSHAKPVRREN
jgi:hypothetical protein